MATFETKDQPAHAIEDERSQEPPNDEVPDTKSGVRLTKNEVLASAKYRTGDVVHTATITNGQRIKSIFTIHAAVYNPKGWVEYQVLDSLSHQLYRHGAGIREKDLRPGA
ncbi:uncharacterized protein M421DRAFT_4946 [Didymella exigua CBS 183.55]|uniref:Uncharacterized protein n=1 Tax=Didymella exigua CBS 183.55 TaxID=1150837 RepID=A0A6A5RUW7_9PLEO|nr:uncharacterized protein M421DRAFT_4946 [Didymella exigua CBS 183.55]KAF1929147.1 hypothetical protein M421DRAFT_4946 [Didymella exigua CBS 183.55]